MKGSARLPVDDDDDDDDDARPMRCDAIGRSTTGRCVRRSAVVDGIDARDV
jgi:hypothetical protein